MDVVKQIDLLVEEKNALRTEVEQLKYDAENREEDVKALITALEHWKAKVNQLEEKLGEQDFKSEAQIAGRYSARAVKAESENQIYLMALEQIQEGCPRPSLIAAEALGKAKREIG